MIKSYKSTAKGKALKKLFETGSAKGLDPNHKEKLLDRLDALDAAVEVGDMSVPGWDFHPLTGDRSDDYSVHVNGNWCVTFQFEDGNAYVINYEDYH